MFCRVKRFIGGGSVFFGLVWLAALASTDDMAMSEDLYTPIGSVVLRAILGLAALGIGAYLLGGGVSENESKS